MNFNADVDLDDELFIDEDQESDLSFHSCDTIPAYDKQNLLSCFHFNDLKTFTFNNLSLWENDLHSNCTVTECCNDENFSNYIDHKEIIDKINSTQNKNTEKKHKWAVTKFGNWLKTQPLHMIPRYDLQEYLDTDIKEWLPRFIIQVKDKNGEKYKPKTLFEMILSLQQYINDYRQRQNQDIVKFLVDNKYFVVKQVLDAEMKDACKHNLNFTHKQSDIIDEHMENMLWEEEYLSAENPRKLLTTVLYLIGLHFALRGGQEHKQLTVDNFELIHKDGKNALKYKETFSKTYHGGIAHLKRAPKEVIAFENVEKPDRCIIGIFSTYMQHRPNEVKRFYLTPITAPTSNIWYSVQPIGINTINKVIPNLCKAANFNGKYTNHSLRATAATRLFANGIEEQLVASITGHSSLAVRSYKRISSQQRETLSNILQLSTSQNSYIPSITNQNRTVQIGTKPDITKKMKIEIDGNCNKVLIEFQ